MSEKKKYDSTVARIAGNLLSGCIAANGPWAVDLLKVKAAVEAARAIVAETINTEPQDWKP